MQRPVRIAAVGVGLLVLAVASQGPAPQIPGPEPIVYVVPDVPTFLYYLSLWDRETRFPIFIGEDDFSERFIRAYPGAMVKKVEAIRVGDVTPRLAYRALYAAWGPEKLDNLAIEVTKEALKERLQGLGGTPEGIVLTNCESPEFSGGMALAAAHRQILDFYSSDTRADDNVGLFGHGITSEQKEKIRKGILEIIKGWGYPYEGTGNGIDYITIAFSVHYSYKGVKYHQGDAKEEHGFTLDDAVNRLTPDGRPPGARADGSMRDRSTCYAYVGRLWEIEKGMALYQAMCSLFLPVQRALVFDSWARSYDRPALEGSRILETRVVTGYFGPGLSTKEQWHKLMKSGNPCQYLHIQTAGASNTWHVGTQDDVADGVPCILYLAHSFAGQNPKSDATLGGRWLRRGAYLMYVSIMEPYAPSFNKAEDVARALVRGQPVGLAFEQKETLAAPFTFPWRLMLIGDPLCRVRFAPDRSDRGASKTFRDAMATLLAGQFEAGRMALEAQVGRRSDGDWQGRAEEALQRTYLLEALAGAMKVRLDQSIGLPFVADWYGLDPTVEGPMTPALGLYFTMHADMLPKALTHLDAVAQREGRPGVKKVVSSQIDSLRRSATFAKEWLAAGPFEMKWDQAYPPEKEETFDPKRTYTSGSYTARWMSFRTQPVVNVLNLARGAPPGSIVYLLGYVTLSGEEARQAKVWIGSTGRGLAWVNGKVAMEFSGSPAAPREEEFAVVQLTPGDNKVLIKVGCGGPRSLLSFRVTDLSGRWSPEITYARLQDKAREGTATGP